MNNININKHCTIEIKRQKYPVMCTEQTNDFRTQSGAKKVSYVYEANK